MTFLYNYNLGMLNITCNVLNRVRQSSAMIGLFEHFHLRTPANDSIERKDRVSCPDIY